MISNGSVYYIENKEFDQHQISKLIEAQELNSIHLYQITTDFFSIGNPFTDSLINYYKFVSLMNCKITQGFFIENSKLINGIFVSSLQNTGYIRIAKSIFEEKLYFWHGNYEKGLFDFEGCDFKDDVNMRESKFEIPFRIYNCNFDSTLTLTGSMIKETFLIQDSRILNLLLRSCEFQSKPRFNRVTIQDTIDFTNTNFEKGIDLRRINLSKVNAIFFENTFYPPGELILYWEEIKGGSRPRISIKDLSEDKEDNYKRIEEIYNRLYQNYIALGDKTSADEVLYELAWQKEIIVGGIW